MKKPHIRYKLKDGTIVPGVTTVTGELGWNKQVLVSWANKLGLQGIDSAKFVDDKAQIGTLAHQMVLDHFRKVETDTSDFTANQISAAENCLISYHAWEKGKTVEPILIEEPLVSEVMSFGGTPDFYGKIDGVLTLCDYKTGKGIYPEYFVQVAGGYLRLLSEHGHKVEQIIILNIPRSEDESFMVKPIPITKWEVAQAIFDNCLETYRLKKQLNGGE